jgi:hypothetical protein
VRHEKISSRHDHLLERKRVGMHSRVKLDLTTPTFPLPFTRLFRVSSIRLAAIIFRISVGSY